MTSIDFKRRARKEVTTYLGVLPLIFGGMYCPFAISGRYPNYVLISSLLVGVGAIVLLLTRFSLDAPILLAKRLAGALALGLATGIFVFEAAWAELLHSWYEYATAFLGYAFACWCIMKFVDLRVDQWRH